jgi:muconolactone delta-isomerase
MISMKILALEKELPGLTPDAFKCFSEQEARKAWELHQAGLIRELYFRADQSTAVLVLECASTDEAKAVLAELPFISHGLIEFELIPLVAYPGFEKLFKKIRKRQAKSFEG